MAKDGWQPGIQTFPAPDIRAIATKLKLEERGKELAARGDVILEADPVQEDIDRDILQRAKTSTDEYRHNLEVLEGRLRDAAMDDAASVQIEAAAAAGLGNFAAHCKERLLPLRMAEAKISGVQREFQQFVARHELQHVDPIVVPRSTQLWGWALVAVVWLVESAMNAFFFAEGSTAGLLGGFLEASALSFVNIFLATLLAMAFVPYARHRSVPLRVVGVLGSGAVVLGILLVNVVIAHYREAFAAAEGQRVDFTAVIAAVRDSPFVLSDAKGWLLGALGLAASIISYWKISTLDDPYPGFGAIARRRDNAILDLHDERSASLESLKNERDQTMEAMNEALSTVANKKHDFELAIRSRARLRTQYKEHIDELRAAHARLSGLYNAAAGKMAADSSFRIPIDQDLPSGFTIDAQCHERAIEAMRAAVKRLAEEFEEGVRTVDEASAGVARGEA